MRLRKKCIVYSLLGLLLLVPMGALSESYEGEDTRVYGRNPLIIELGDMKGGYRISVEYNVTAYWPGMMERNLTMDILRNGSSVLSLKKGECNISYLVREPGNFSVRFKAGDHSSDWKKFDYSINTTAPTELFEAEIDVGIFTDPPKPAAGSECSLSLEVGNPNQWPVRLDTLTLSMSSIQDRLILEDLNTFIEPGFSELVNTTLQIPLETTEGPSECSVDFDFKMKVHGSWYEDLSFLTPKFEGLSFGPVDSDEDGVPDNQDTYPEDPSMNIDSDGDGVGNEEDDFPFDPEESSDSDGDGIGDNSDVFPSDPAEWYDMDQDGVGDNSDAFPKDPAASIDTDGDGYPDSWNTGMSEADSTDNLKLDNKPSDGEKWRKSEDSPMISILFLPVIAMLVGYLIFTRRRCDK